MSVHKLWPPPPPEHSPVAASDRPRDGDVMITQPHSPSTYALSQYPGPAQITTTSRETALDVARGFARRLRVDVWIVEKSRTTRVSCHRSTVPPN
jgi:hypothetical protein